MNDKDVKVIYSDIMSDEEKNEEFAEYESPLTNGEYSVVYECGGWQYAIEALRDIPAIDSNYQYILHFEMQKEKLGNITFGTVAMGLLIDRYPDEKLVLGCNCWESNDGENHFWLLRYNG